MPGCKLQYWHRSRGYPLLLEQGVEIGEGICADARPALVAARAEPIAAVCPLRVGHPFGARFAAFVVRRGIVKTTVLADVQIGAAMIATLAEPHASIRCEFDSDVAAEAFHGTSVGHGRPDCQDFSAIEGAETHSAAQGLRPAPRYRLRVGSSNPRSLPSLRHCRPSGAAICPPRPPEVLSPLRVLPRALLPRHRPHRRHRC